MSVRDEWNNLVQSVKSAGDKIKHGLDDTIEETRSLRNINLNYHEEVFNFNDLPTEVEKMRDELRSIENDRFAISVLFLRRQDDFSVTVEGYYIIGEKYFKKSFSKYASSIINLPHDIEQELSSKKKARISISEEDENNIAYDNNAESSISKSI